MSEKRFNIVPSNVVEDGKFIQDNKKEHSFPTTKDTSTLVMYEKALNELATKCSQLEKENEQLKKENKELKQDNDIKFWKLQYMRQHNSTQLIVHEVSLAIEQGYEVSDEFKKYIDDLKENNKKTMEKNKRLFGDSDD